MANYFTLWQNSVTAFSADNMNSPLSQLDAEIASFRNLIVHTAGSYDWNSTTGKLTWSADIEIIYTKSDGSVIKNVISASNCTITDNQMAYVDLSSTNGATITVTVASITLAAASTTCTSGRVVLAYRNTSSDNLFLINLKNPHNISYPILNPTVAATTSIDISDGVQFGYLTVDQDTTINLSGAPCNGFPFTLHVTFDATGGWTITWGTMVAWSTDVPEPEIDNSANAEFYIGFRYDTVTSKYRVMAINEGF